MRVERKRRKQKRLERKRMPRMFDNEKKKKSFRENIIYSKRTTKKLQLRFPNKLKK